MSQLKEDIHKILFESNLPTNEMGYVGFDMSKTHSQEDTNKKIQEHNEKILNLFIPNFLPKGIEKLVDCWKGLMYIKDKEKDYGEFGGLTTEEILERLIVNNWEEDIVEIEREIENEKIKEEEIDVTRIILKKERYEVLRRQKWRCNICGEVLKFNSHSDWDGVIAHIDHIYPFSKRKTYPNGISNINETSNLQALCPNCNFKKKDKEIQ